MNSPRSKLRGIRSASLRFTDNKDLFWFVVHPALQGAGNSQLNKIGEMAEGPEKYDLFRKKHKGIMLCKWSRIEKFRYVEYLIQNKPETFPSLTKEQF